MAKKNYFDNEAVTKAILEYKEFLEKGTDKVEILHPYTSQIQQLVKGVINTHKIYRWWHDVDELVQEGMVAIYSSFKRFNPEKGTAFNYLSIVAKQHLKNWTQTRNKKAFQTSEFQDDIYNSHTVAEDTTTIEQLFFEVEVPVELEKTLAAIVEVITRQKIHNKRDIIKYLFRQGYLKKDIDNVFKQLEIHFGDMNE